MSVKIDKDVPLPLRNGDRKRIYPWRELEVGDSFFVPCEPGEKPAETANRVRSSGNWYIVRHGMSWKLTTARVDGGARCWRTK